MCTSSTACMGVQQGTEQTLMPASSACLTMLALRVMSSYEELVQDPIRLAVSWLGQPFSLMDSANCTGHSSQA